MKKINITNAIVSAIKLIVLCFCLAVWAVIGLFLWIPLLARTILIYSFAVTSAMFSNVSTTNAENALNFAITFYIQGFMRTMSFMEKPDHMPMDRGGTLTIGGIFRIVTNLLWSVLFWYLGKMAFNEEFRASQLRQIGAAISFLRDWLSAMTS